MHSASQQISERAVVASDELIVVIGEDDDIFIPTTGVSDEVLAGIKHWKNQVKYRGT